MSVVREEDEREPILISSEERGACHSEKRVGIAGADRGRPPNPGIETTLRKFLFEREN